MKTFLKAYSRSIILVCLSAFAASDLIAETTTLETTILGPFSGEGATLHEDNQTPHRIHYYGTDLGWTYEHKGSLQILFGDTMANNLGDPIDATKGKLYDDAYGSIDLSRWSDPTQFSQDNIPAIRLGQVRNSREAAAIDPGHALEGFKTPVSGFSNGEQEFGIFFTYKPKGCHSHDDCPNGLACDVGLGFVGPAWDDDEGITFGCVEGSSDSCQPATLPATGEVLPSGFCLDLSSSVWSETDIGRTSAVSTKLLIGTRNPDDPSVYKSDHEWHTNRFLNPSVRTVQSFDPQGEQNVFGPAMKPDETSRVFVWGRPGFIGVGATDRDLQMYFAYTDLPEGASYEWDLNYFSGLDADGIPRFSRLENAAAAIDLDSTQPGVQPDEVIDVVNQVSIAWMPSLEKWLMIYGGGMVTLPVEPALTRCGVLELFTGAECDRVEIGKGAFYLRTSDHPWGPWTPPQELIAGGDPAGPPIGQYGIGGMLRHPECKDPGCAPHTAARDVNPREYGFFYSANIIEQWTHATPGEVNILWNASTWDPYRVILLRTTIKP